MHYYFAYGSNMNRARMAARGLTVLETLPGKLGGMTLRFNKRARRPPHCACANVCWSPGSVVEGVLYRLADEGQITLMDPFEGAPRYYSRERFPIQTAQETVYAWVYVANPAVIDDSVLPQRWYLDHLLAGEPYLSDSYLRFLREVRCDENNGAGWG